MKPLSQLMQSLFLGLLWIYRNCISPLLPPSCRFVPSCSQYATDAIKQYGAIIGSFLALKRLLRCHPFARAGIDEVPVKRANEGKQSYKSEQGYKGEQNHKGEQNRRASRIIKASKAIKASKPIKANKIIEVSRIIKKGF